MDRGAARSKKRALKAQAQAQAPAQSQPQPQPQAGPSKPRPQGSQAELSGQPTLPISNHKKRDRHLREEQSKDPSLYVPKAIRTSSALIYSKEPFDLPPSPERLANVTRIDLAGSGVKDVSWLKDAKGVTWLSLNGCQIESGWEQVGELDKLTVLNINGCGLSELPSSLGGLKGLKALVAMNNDWKELNEEVLKGWKELNSLIISHSPNLISLPTTLSSLYHLSKLTFSHCPKLTSDSLPDLSQLPLLRDVKMNNLPLLTQLPSHIVNWGKGNLDKVGKGKNEDEFGDGLEVLDLGNCSLSFDSIKTIFNLGSSSSSNSSGTKRKNRWDHLRSLSLHSNPLTTTHPNYVEMLQNNSGVLPNLQIIDAKRVIERKRKGEISEKKIKHKKEKEKNVRPSGSNVTIMSGEMRKWGSGKQDNEESNDAIEAEGEGEFVDKKKTNDKSSEKRDKDKKESKKRKHNDQAPVERTEGEEKNKKQKRTRIPSPAAAPAPAQEKVKVKDITDSSRITQTKINTDMDNDEKNKNKEKSSKQRDAVVGLIEINAKGEAIQLDSKKKKKMKAKLKKDGEGGGVSGGRGRGIDLREVFGKSKNVIGQDTHDDEKNDEGEGQDNGWGSGLGVGGW
ncbi:uncharacterized protein L199_001332 [Kwoniella botswanensis]|uniref:uncharacterized protein n=1 Tax=Kwoniella botswanensis TaxID=1268659 RepID=UPI00315CF0DD